MDIAYEVLEVARLIYERLVPAWRTERLTVGNSEENLKKTSDANYLIGEYCLEANDFEHAISEFG